MKEEPFGSDDQQRQEIIQQMQQCKPIKLPPLNKSNRFISLEIIKKTSEPPSSSDDEIEQLLHGYISCCHNAGMELMQKQASRAAGRVLRQCQEFLQGNIPQQAADIVLRKGILHTVFNNLAQHANMTADMHLSIDYLEKALLAAENPDTEQELLPLAETYLNLANGYSFLEKFENALGYAEKALKFAKLRCE